MQVRWRGFRCFSDTGWIDIRPVTLLIGPNNAGKSSVIAPLLLLKQTLRARYREVQLLTHGELFNGGEFEDLVYDGNLKRHLRFSFRFGDVRKPTSSKVGRLDPETVAGVALSFGHDVTSGQPVLSSYTVVDAGDRTLLTRSRLSNGSYSLSGVPASDDALTARRVKPKSWTSLDDDTKAAVVGGRPNHFLFEGTPPLVAAFRSLQERLASKEPNRESDLYVRRFLDSTMRYVQVLSRVEEVVSGYLRNVEYIGPLRERPRRLYESSGELPANVGTRGQSAPELLFHNQELRSKVNDWLRRFDFSRSVTFKRGAEGSFALRFKAERGDEVNFADTGFGISQILPLIVQGLSAGPRSTIIAEQPEIHLNPKLQGVLADLFVSIAASGSGVIVETHSEHLLLRLRRLVAEGVVASTDVAIYYVDKSQRQPVMRIPLTKEGGIERHDWPSGFFEDALREALGLANAQATSSSHDA